MNTDRDLINVLNIVPESWSFLSERKKVEATQSFMDALVEHLKLPQSEKEWKLFNQLKEAKFFDHFVLYNLWYLPEDRSNFFIKEFRQNLELSENLIGLQFCAENCRIPILHAIGEEQLWSFLADTKEGFSPLLDAINYLHGEVALELIKMLDSQLVKNFKSQITFFASKYFNALYIYLQIVDPKNLINSKFREEFSTYPPMHVFNEDVFLLIPKILWLEVLKQYPVDKEIFKLLDATMGTTVLSKEYNLTKLKPDEIVPYLGRKDIWRIAILCHDKKTIIDMLSGYMESKLLFLRAVNDITPLNKRGILKEDFYTILKCLNDWEASAAKAMEQFYSQFNISEFECRSFVKMYTPCSDPAPIVIMVDMVNLLIKDLNDINNLKTIKLLEVKNWLECTKQFDKPHQNQILLLIRDICALKQGYLKMFTPKSEEFFIKQCKFLYWHVFEIDAKTINLFDIPPILDETALKANPLDIPALMEKIQRYLICNYTKEGGILALDEWDDLNDDKKPPQGPP